MSKASYVKAAFPTGKVAQSLAALGSTEHEAWLQAKRDSKANWFGYAPESVGPSFD